MTHTLYLSDGTEPGTVQLSTEYAHLLHYVPAAPKLSTVDLTPSGIRDGGERTSTTRRNVTESAVVRFQPTATAITNVLLNPSAEAPISTASFAATGGSTITQSTAYALHGSYSYRVQTAADDAGLWLQTQAMANAAHYVSFYARGTIPTLQVVIAGVPVTPAVIGTSGSWTRYGAAFTAGTCSASTAINILQDGAGAGDFYVDCVQAEVGTAATAYCDGDQGPTCYWHVWPGVTHAGQSSRVAGIDAVRSLVRGIERLFVQAERYQSTRHGTPVYINLQPGSSGDIYRSEILSGQVALDELALDVQDWGNAAGEVKVVYTRRFYWEGPEAELSLSNGGGSGTGGLTIYNHDDATAGHDAYVEIVPNAMATYTVGGSLPTPARLVLNNNYADALNWPLRLYVGQAICWGDVVPPVCWEAEAGTGGATSDDATCSGTGGGGGIGQKVTLTLTAAEAELLYWTFSSAQSDAMAAGYYRCLARFPTKPTAATQVRLQVFSGSQVLWTGPLVTLSASLALQDLGVLQIPPWMAGDLTLGSIKLALRGLLAGSGSLVLDFVLFLPLDSYRYINTVVGYVQTNRAVDDGPRGAVYIDSGESTAVMGGVVVNGGPLWLWPTQLQRIYVLHDARNSAGTETAPIERTLSLRVFYRPRRLSF